MALELLLLLRLDGLEEYDLLLVERQLLAQAADLLGELLDFGLLDSVLEPIPVRVAENRLLHASLAAGAKRFLDRLKVLFLGLLELLL